MALLLRASNKEFLELVGNVAEYRKWCETNLNKKPNTALIANTKSFFISKNYKTASEKLESEGFKRLSKEQLERKYEELNIHNLSNKESNTLLTDIFGNVKLNSHKDFKNEKFAEAYWDWCEKESKKSLLEYDFYAKGYDKFKTRCADIESLKLVLKKTEEIRKTNSLVKEVLDFEKENSCDIHFVFLGAENAHYKADNPIWSSEKIKKEIGNRNLYKEFVRFVKNSKTKKNCKELNGKRYLVSWQWDKKVWE